MACSLLQTTQPEWRVQCSNGTAYPSKEQKRRHGDLNPRPSGCWSQGAQFWHRIFSQWVLVSAASSKKCVKYTVWQSSSHICARIESSFLIHQHVYLKNLSGSLKEWETQGGPNVLKIAPEASKQLLCHFWSFFEILFFFRQKSQKRCFFLMLSPPKPGLFGRGTIIDWSTLPHCSSRKNSNITNFWSLEGDRLQSWPISPFRIFLAPPIPQKIALALPHRRCPRYRRRTPPCMHTSWTRLWSPSSGTACKAGAARRGPRRSRRWRGSVQQRRNCQRPRSGKHRDLQLSRLGHDSNRFYPKVYIYA